MPTRSIASTPRHGQARIRFTVDSAACQCVQSISTVAGAVGCERASLARPLGRAHIVTSGPPKSAAEAVRNARRLAGAAARHRRSV